MSPGVLLATALIVAIGFCCFGVIWVVTSPHSPLPRWWHRRRLERTVRIGTDDLDRKIIDFVQRTDDAT